MYKKLIILIDIIGSLIVFLVLLVTKGLLSKPLKKKTS